MISNGKLQDAFIDAETATYRLPDDLADQFTNATACDYDMLKAYRQRLGRNVNSFTSERQSVDQLIRDLRNYEAHGVRIK
jgi:hypothetical protein